MIKMQTKEEKEEQILAFMAVVEATNKQIEEIIMSK